MQVCVRPHFNQCNSRHFGVKPVSVLWINWIEFICNLLRFFLASSGPFIIANRVVGSQTCGYLLSRSQNVKAATFLWCLAVINILRLHCSKNALLRLIERGRNRLDESLRRVLGLHSAHTEPPWSRVPESRSKPNFLGHSCIAALASQEAMYNACGMYNI